MDETNEDTRRYELSEDLYKADLAILDRFQGYSKDVAKIAGAGVGASWAILIALGVQVKGGAAVGLGAAAVLFALSIGVSLFHLYRSSDALVYYVDMLRARDPAKRATAKEGLHTSLRDSTYLVRIAAVLLALGGLALAGAFVAFLGAGARDGVAPGTMEPARAVVGE